MARTLNGVSASAQSRRQALIIDRNAAKYERRIAAEISRAMREAAKNIRGKKKNPVKSIRAEHEKNIMKLMVPLWSGTMKESAENTVNTKKSIDLLMERKASDEILLPVNPDKIARDWVKLFGAAKVKDIAKTTMSDVNRSVRYGLDNGLSEIEISKLITVNSPIKGLSRAQTIARTESHQAMNVASMATAKATGVTLRKQWISSKGDRTREEHADADGQIVAMDQSFNVGGEALAFPGDPAGSAWNVINCRCVVVFIL